MGKGSFAETGENNIYTIFIKKHVTKTVKTAVTPKPVSLLLLKACSMPKPNSSSSQTCLVVCLPVGLDGTLTLSTDKEKGFNAHSKALEKSCKNRFRPSRFTTGTTLVSIIQLA